MKFFGIFFLLFITTSSSLFSQEKYITHQIAKGETISTIAEKYQVPQKVIFELNPKASGILKLKSVLKIPNKNYKKELAQKELVAKKKSTKVLEYEVLPKETWFGIAKKFQLSVDEIQKSNPSIVKDGLKTGNKLKLLVPENFELKQEVVDVQKATETDSTTTPINEFVTSNRAADNKVALQSHTVVASETKYGIAKRYGVTVAELEKINPILVTNKLDIGQLLSVPLQATKGEIVQNNELPSVVPPSDSEVVVVQTTSVNNEKASVENTATVSKEISALVHEVLPKETKFGIAKKYGITVDELEKLNPTIQNTLRVGLVLKIKDAPFLATESVAIADEASKSEAGSDTLENSKKVFGDFALADELIEKASGNLGIRYRSGGTSRSGFDCSGLMITTFGALDIQLPRTSAEQSNVGFKIDLQEAKKGDLIFFKTRGSGRINHVGMVVDVDGDEVKFIHSSTSNGVIISSTKENYYHRNFAQVNRVLK